ncbi:hypothetical protein Dimus_006584 [Dionaea muscipula]
MGCGDGDGGGGGGGDTFAKTICTICYEDLKPIVEDLQVISLCGHVFHELCLQQWLEYCTTAKKQTCPVCKQICSSKSISRLYFQSLVDPVEISSLSRPRIVDVDENPEELRREVKRLEAKVSGLDSILECHRKDVEQLTEQLCICKDQLGREVKLKNEALLQKEYVQGVLQKKSSELLHSTMECSRLQDSNMALAKELAALKLVSDCNLEEDDIIKLASLGNEATSQDAIDVLKKSLVVRNKNYKELMAKCNSLGRGEARSVRKLEKAKAKVTKLKARVKELELAIEAKDNEVLRMLKASKKTTGVDVAMSSDKTSNSSICKHPSDKQNENANVTIINLDEERDSDVNILGVKGNTDELSNVNAVQDYNSGIGDEHMNIFHHHLRAENVSEQSKVLNRNSPQDGARRNLAGFDACSDDKLTRPNNQEVSNSRRDTFDGTNVCSVAEATSLHLEDIRQVPPSLHSKTDASSPLLLSEPGDGCFAGSLFGPDGSSRHLGKWCKLVQNNGPIMPPSTTQNKNAGSFIATGADGRGGRVKVLRSPNLSFLDGTEAAVSAKKSRLGSKAAGALPAHGCWQMEHFFGRART